jgi:radical SAM superfamily enzyme YgiQ (UPF0313 family)
MSSDTRHTILLVQAVDYDTRTLVGFQPLCTPLSIATIAALTSDEFIVDLWDENLDGLIDEQTRLPHEHYDIVGISTLFEEIGRRVPTLAALFRARGTYVCAGGPGISNQLKMIGACVDSAFLNEAEYTWPQFLKDWCAGNPQREYVQIAKPDLADSPAPRWDALASRVPDYRSGGVQTTRGCPFDCEFCDVIYLFGRVQRHKPVERVLAEVRALQKLGQRRIFFTDDEFIGDPRYARALLSELVPLNNSFPHPIAYHTQLTLNLSRHDDLLEYVADANFWHVLIGVESFSEDSLKETNKLQNCNRDIIADCRKILSYGIGINGSLIVGFDHDGANVFDRILNGVQAACIPFASVSILRATQGTKLWTRLRENKRLWKLRNAHTLPQALQMDILPGGSLTRADLIEGRIYVNKELSRVSNLCRRLHGWMDLLRRHPRVEDPHRLTLDNAVKRLRGHQALALSTADIRLLEEVLEHVHSSAPVMMDRVVDSVFAQLYWYKIRTFHTEEDLQTALAAERDGDLVADTKPVLVPTAFAKAFRRRLFPLVYHRLSRNLPEAGMIPDAASEIFVDFLVRIANDTHSENERSFDSPRHDEFLRVLCDRAVTRVTGGPPAECAEPSEDLGPAVKSLKRTGLYDAVLKDVADRMSRLNDSLPAARA